MATYDDFNGRRIDPNKWNGIEAKARPRGVGGEAIREIQDERLRLLSRFYGRTDSDAGQAQNELLLLVSNSAPVTAMSATVQVSNVQVTGCATNSTTTKAWAMLAGRFFGTPSSTAKGPVRDVVASIRVVRHSDSEDPRDVLRVISRIFHCSRPACTTGERLHDGDLGTVRLGERTKLRLEWDRVEHRFIFQMGEKDAVAAPYTLPDTEPPFIHVRVLETLSIVPNCTGTPRPEAFIEAFFDDVMVNKSAATLSRY